MKKNLKNLLFAFGLIAVASPLMAHGDCCGTCNKSTVEVVEAQEVAQAEETEAKSTADKAEQSAQAAQTVARKDVEPSSEDSAA